MNYHILTLFPEMVMDGLNTSIIGRAVEKGLISIEAINIRDYSKDKHNHVDDAPYGGGAGMVMQPGPVCDSYEDLCRKIGKRPRVLYMTPQGQTFNQSIAEELAKEEDLVFLCGHYEGIDERALELIVTDYLSVGDYVLTGGELPAMVMIDCISRLVPGVLNNDVSAEFESFHDNLLEYPQYTRPVVFMDKAVPDILLTGHHKNIETWRRQKSIERTLERRPDLLKDAVLDKKEKKYLDECGPANFFGIRGNSYITPQSHSILPSITNKSLQQLAEDMGLTVERRPVPFEEIATFDEAAECGTAAVIAPISQIDDLDENKSFVIAKDGKPGPVCEKLYHKLRAIQYGDEPDTYGWISIIE